MLRIFAAGSGVRRSIGDMYMGAVCRRSEPDVQHVVAGVANAVNRAGLLVLDASDLVTALLARVARHADRAADLGSAEAVPWRVMQAASFETLREEDDVRISIAIHLSKTAN